MGRDQLWEDDPDSEEDEYPREYSIPKKWKKLRDVDVGGKDAATFSAVLQLNKPARKAFVHLSVKTARYTILSFVPKFLFHQLHHRVNIFLVVVSALQVHAFRALASPKFDWITQLGFPNLSPLDRFTLVVPFGIVILAIAIKEIVEDFVSSQSSLLCRLT